MPPLGVGQREILAAAAFSCFVLVALALGVATMAAPAASDGDEVVSLYLLDSAGRPARDLRGESVTVGVAYSGAERRSFRLRSPDGTESTVDLGPGEWREESQSVPSATGSRLTWQLLAEGSDEPLREVWLSARGE